MAGAVRRVVPLRWPDYRLDADALAAAVTDRTQLLLINTPHNPTGRVLDSHELAAVAALAQARDLLVVTDEVYEHLVFDGSHIPLATLPGMRERTLTVSSAGKTFAMTAHHLSAANKYVQSVQVNGHPLDNPFLPFPTLRDGGTLVFEMGPRPSAWGTAPQIPQ